MAEFARLVVVAALLAVALTGCRQQYDSASDWLLDQPGVETVEDRGNLTPILPLGYEGTIRGHVSADMSDSALAALADAAGDHLTDSSGDADLRYELARGDFVISADPDHNLDLEQVDAISRYADDTQVTGAVLRPDFALLFAEPGDLATVFDRFQADTDLQVSDGSPDAGGDRAIWIQADPSGCGYAGSMAFMDELFDTDYPISGPVCGEIEVRVDRDALVESSEDLRARWIAAGEPDNGLTVFADFGQFSDREIDATDLDDAGLSFVRDIAESDELGDARLRVGSTLDLDDADGTVCQLLGLVRDADGFGAFEKVDLTQVGGDEPVRVLGVPSEVVAYVDARTTASGCGVSGIVDLDE